MDAERYKDQLREAKYRITKLEFKVEKLVVYQAGPGRDNHRTRFSIRVPTRDGQASHGHRQLHVIS